jgi:hypothetical protein
MVRARRRGFLFAGCGVCVEPVTGAYGNTGISADGRAILLPTKQESSGPATSGSASNSSPGYMRYASAIIVLPVFISGSPWFCMDR